MENDDFLNTAGDLIKQAKKRIEEIAKLEEYSGISTGLKKLDLLTSGFQSSDLIVIAGRPSMGKSSFVLSITRNVAIEFGIPVALFSPEMSSSQIINRLICSETGLSLSKLRMGELEPHEWELLSVKTKSIETAPIYIDDSYNLTIQKLSDLARLLVSENNVRIIIIDNIHQLSSGDIGKGNFTREQEISTIVRALKSLAKELKIPIVAVAQLSRDIEYRNSHRRPILNDLRGSGTIEEIADIVSFIYRPEYYKIEEWDDDDAFPTAGQAELIVAKHRNGTLENIRFKFDQNRGKFDSLDEFSGGFDDLPSKKNKDDNPFSSKNLPSPNEAFGSNLNDDDDDSDVPF
ncbi:replicative DNA helicase [Flavobacterium hercynium]|uniref:SF4 helicase domain-containing protein n=1 Tax=Flavobacterium hercynium TaxID=387094 RepID=A0A226HMI8_9FLAO|nr:DnaB-like helicase C-terminal domain-containing protein [Flavobacterium hercynium]OXA95539.1 hypothetical protein B0A66_02415 [Flavobacterium hercynium]SMP23153.1 replicative DNA helicase [Flavobacterium hercynium]